MPDKAPQSLRPVADGAPVEHVSPLHDVEAVVFDVDDTICDSAGAFSLGIRKIVAHYMPQLDEDSILRAINLWRADPSGHYRRYARGECSFDEQRFCRANELNDTFGGPEITWDEYATVWKPLFWNTFCSNWHAHTDVRPCLDALAARGIKIGAVSNASAELQRRKLDACDCPDVPLLVTMDTFGVGKPDSRVFLEAARKLNVTPPHVMYVGDEFDIDAQAACVAGLVGVWLDRPARHLASRRTTLPVDDGGVSESQVIRVESLAEIPRLLS